MQLEELVGDNDTARELIVRDYHANPDPPTAAQVSATLEELDGLSDNELLDFTTLARVFGYPSTPEAQDSAMSSRGYRAMAGIPASAVRARRPVGPLVRVVAGATGGKRE